MRLFVALNFPKKERDRIYRSARVLREIGLPVRWVDPENYHVTLKFLGNVAEDRIFIPSSVAASWYNAATLERHTVTAVSRLLGQKINEKKLARLIKTRSYGRGFVWVGENADPGAKMKTDIEQRISINEKR